MTLAEAVALIQTNHLKQSTQPQQWADLGCGSGLFSKALLQLLPAGSVIHAADMQLQHFIENNIQFHQLDFVKDDLPFHSLNGILIANALHYVKDKAAVLSKLKKHVSPGGSFIIVEYDTMKANQWVPYPINFESLKQLFKSSGFSNVEKISQRLSVYNSANMYSAYIYNLKEA